MYKNVASLICAIAIALPACGRKADPQPPELVRPETIRDLTAAITKDGVRLIWTRPDENVKGDTLDDLGGFLVFRGAPGEIAKQIADVQVADRDRFRRQKKYETVDKEPPGGESYYRIISYTTDEYFSAPSNQATVTIRR